MREEELNQMSNNELIGIIKAQKFEIEQLENARKEAIEYINTHEYPLPYGFRENDLSKKELLEILQIKGE